MPTYLNEDKAQAERAALRVAYGAGQWQCASCQRIRPMTDLARMYVDDDFFMLCHGVDDGPGTCHEKYERGRERFARTSSGRARRG